MKQIKIYLCAHNCIGSYILQLAMKTINYAETDLNCLQFVFPFHMTSYVIDSKRK